MESLLGEQSPTDSPYQGEQAMPMNNDTWYKWVLGISGTLLMIFTLSYMADLKNVQANVLDHEKRVTTLEESNRYQEQLLEQMRNQLNEIHRAVTRPDYQTR